MGKSHSAPGDSSLGKSARLRAKRLTAPSDSSAGEAASSPQSDIGPAVPDAANSSIHGATCHACLLVAETSCERGNRYLDRSTLADTFRHTGLEFFK